MKNSHFEALLQSIGLKNSHVIYIFVSILGISLLIFAFKVYCQQKKPLTLKKVCEDVNTGAILEMTSGSSINDSPTNLKELRHWDEIHDDFIDFNLAKPPEVASIPKHSLVSLYSNTMTDFDFNYDTSENMEDIDLEDTNNATQGINCKIERFLLFTQNKIQDMIV